LRARLGEGNGWVGAGVALLLCYLVLLWVNAGPQGNIHTGDTDNLVRGARVAADCMHLGQWNGCGFIEGTRHTSVGPYPLLQYVPAAALVKLGVSDTTIVELLARLSTLAFAGTLVVAALALRRRPALAVVAVSALLASSLTYQSTSGFGEMLAAFAVIAAVAAVLERRVLAIAVLLFLACLTKETAPPFLVLLTLIAGRQDGDGLLPPRRILLPAAAGIVSGTALSLAFNVFRFGTPRNLLYLDPQLRTPGLTRKLGFLAAEWLSPNAGIAAFWPLATLVLVVTGIATIVRLRRAIRGRTIAWRSWLPGLTLAVTVVTFTAALTSWFTPFGWITYGPRLAVPLLPASVLLALVVEGDTFLDAISWLGRHAAVLSFGVLVLVTAGWAQYGAPWRHGPAVQALIAADDQCPRMTDYNIQQDVDRYYRCSWHTMWRLSPSVLRVAATGGSTAADAGRVLAAAATGLGLVGMTQLRRPEERPLV
jgi:hypothetical protein